jgi:hypothetical protein
MDSTTVFCPNLAYPARDQIGQGASIMASATPAVSAPRHRPLALEREACEDSDVMLRGHKEPRRHARPMISPSVFAW